jgi:sigma-B regulation protein RsbU (phosphoserine phosphatase)
MAYIPRILTIEDESTIRGNIVAYLEDSGFEMLEAADGASGVETFRREKPDAVLCDLRLPGMDGLDVLETLTGEAPETPVIIVSGVSHISYAVQALKRGAWDYVVKPIQDMGVLESAVRRALEKASLMRRNREYREHLEALNRELEADEEAGRRVQFQLLPEDNRRFGDFTFTRRLYPSMYLSGDFVDYFAIDAHHLGFYIADVSGHGVASAFVTVMLKTLVAQYRESLWNDRDPTILDAAGTLQRLNRDLRQQSLEHYATMFYGVIDREKNTLACCTAGQFPHPILHDGQAAKALEYRGRPVGLFDDAEFTAHEVALPEQFALLLVSDGILDLLPQPTVKEKQAALSGWMEHVDTGVDVLVEHLRLEKQAQLPDDITLMMVSRRIRHE